MATITVTRDDLDKTSEADDTLLYLIDGIYYEIDLSADNAKKFRDGLTKYLKVSRQVSAKEAAKRIATNGSGDGTAYGDYDPAEVRKWAQENDIVVNDKGRVPEHIVAQWRRVTASASA